jgi:adenosylmethionine-8-amino-7-oxononanoate aminotransferase
MPYTQMKTAPEPLAVTATDGVRLELADGRTLIDGVSSWWTACHGYNHRHIAAAVAAQLKRMPHVMLGGLAHEPALTLARRLAVQLPGDLEHVFFSESGSVSVEIAMKIAVQYWLNQGQAGRTRFVSFADGYHGDTFACMAVCDPEEGMHTMFSGVVPEQIVVALPRTEAQRTTFEAEVARRRGEIAAILLEPLVQGAGGMRFHEADDVAFIRGVCDRQGVLLILDEIMTGFGRTGTMFACQQAGVVPDIITLSKALTGGTLPLAATIASAPVFGSFLSDDPEACLMHGPTYTGNALACAAANASLDLFESEPRLAQVARIEGELSEGLASCAGLDGVVDVRARGAIGVVQLETLDDPTWLRDRFVERGVWIRPFRDIVYVMPPFVATSEDIAVLTGAITDVVGEWSGKR